MNCYYIPGSTSIIDTIAPNDTTTSYGLRVDEVEAKYPQAVLMDFDEAIAEIETAAAQKYRRPPKEIGPGRWEEMLEVLPPMRWVHMGSSESFMISERIWGNYTSIFCRINDTYYELMDVATLKHHEIVKLCQESEA